MKLDDIGFVTNERVNFRLKIPNTFFIRFIGGVCGRANVPIVQIGVVRKKNRENRGIYAIVRSPAENFRVMNVIITIY